MHLIQSAPSFGTFGIRWLRVVQLRPLPRMPRIRPPPSPLGGTIPPALWRVRTLSQQSTLAGIFGMSATSGSSSTSPFRPTAFFSSTSRTCCCPQHQCIGFHTARTTHYQSQTSVFYICTTRALLPRTDHVSTTRRLMHYVTTLYSS